MEIQLVNVGPIRQAELTGDVILLAGNGGAGKTSILRGLRAALTGQPMPADVAKKDAASLVRRGHHEASVTMRDDLGTATVAWPSCDVRQSGQPLGASLVAVGAVSLVDLPVNQAAELMISALKAEPSDEELRQKLAEVGLPDKMAESVIAKVTAEGWDGALKHATTERPKRKGAWERVTGKKWGGKAASDWRPDGWTTNLALITDGRELTGAVDAARLAVDDAIRAGAGNAAELARLSERITLIDGARRTLEDCQKSTRIGSETTIKLGRHLDALPPVPSAGQPCPECGCILCVTDGEITLASNAAGPETIAAARKARADAKVAYDAADKAARAAVAAEAVARAELTALERDKARFGELLADQRAKKPAAAGDEAGARAALERAESRLRLWELMRDADTERRMVGYYEDVIAILEPAGLRKKKLAECLTAFNGRLAALCELVGLPEIAVTDDLAVTYDGQPYGRHSLSTSQRRLTRIVLQVALAEIDGSQALLIDVDRALDGRQKGQILQLATDKGSALGIALVALAFTETAPRPALDISDIGGTTYWVEAGPDGSTVTPIAEIAERLAA